MSIAVSFKLTEITDYAAKTWKVRWWRKSSASRSPSLYDTHSPFSPRWLAGPSLPRRLHLNRLPLATIGTQQKISRFSEPPQTHILTITSLLF